VSGTLERVSIVTITSTVPAEPGGEMTVIAVDPVDCTIVAELPPNVTEILVPKKLVPVISNCPPAKGPEVNERLVTVGVAMFIKYNYIKKLQNFKI
jgi:hypothetical protein